MLVTRIYKPNDTDVLYHYCDADAFHAICTSKRMRFSDIFSMNDFMEMHWGYSIWEQAASGLLQKIGRGFLDEIDRVLHVSGMHGLPVASCYSLDGDVLSQWRAYADDAKGFVIGFSAKDMINLPVRPLKVLYNEKQQIEEITRAVLALHDVEQSQEEKFGSSFRELCFIMALDLCSFKNPAFDEEREVRLLHLLDFKKSNDFVRLHDAGGLAFGHESNGMPIKFRMRDNAPVAFIEQDFTDEEKISPIKEVIIGPKNDVLQTSISVFLETVDIGSVAVKRSTASYR